MKMRALNYFAVLFAAAVMALSFTACGQSGEEVSKEESSSSTTQTEDSSQQSEEPESIDRKVTVTDVTITPIQVYSASVDSYDPDNGYVIEATVSNKNDVSCDVYPTFSITLTSQDDYGASQTREMLLFNSDLISSPYSPDINYRGDTALAPVGIAPNETKTVRYYVGTNSTAPLVVAELDGGRYDEPENLYGTENYSIDGIKLKGVAVKQAEQVYLPADEWSADAHLEAVDFSSTGLAAYGNVLTGTIQNNTTGRWEEGYAQFDLAVNGQTFNAMAVKKTYQTFSFVDVDGSVALHEGDFSISESVATSESPDFEVTLTPALLAYTPDEE